MSYNPEKPYKKQILNLIKKTWDTPYLSIKEGTYSFFKKKFNYVEVDHTDGIGTKGFYYWKKRNFRDAVIDALAINLNDMAIARATPYKLQCHIILPKDDGKAILEIMHNLVRECRKYRIAITGGETSIQNNLNGLDISLTVSGFVKKEMKNQFIKGDVLLGFSSNGLHSNGFTMARKVLGEKLLSSFIKPTKIYLKDVNSLLNKYNIHGCMHITGGAYTKLKSLLNNSDAVIHNHGIKPQLVFKQLYQNGVNEKDMYRTFNYGIGFILSVSKKDSLKIISEYKNIHNIGEVVSGSCLVKIRSIFSGKQIKI